jgi:hypothetical protein
MATMMAWVKAREKRLPGKAKNSDDAKARLLMTSAYYFVVHRNIERQVVNRKEDERDQEALAEIAGRMKLLAAQVRPRTQGDRAWKYFDESMTHFWTHITSGRTAYAAPALHHAGEALHGATSRS